ncbi:MAG: Sir2 family NAD-dependent protein deacetylase [Acidimicrobiales bacterium]|nr:Sir2 family NAD-dependent protein deacetylase [Acidimicrobiales bacterium]
MTETAVALARQLIDDADAVAVLTGAGISTDSGIPDFRGPNGVWTKNPAAEKASNIQYYVNDPEVRKANWAARASGALWANVEPNIGHHALVHLEQRGKLHTLITQNVDELHQRAGNSPELVVEVHGTTRKVQCLACEYRDNMEEALERVRAGEADPDCPRCGGMLKSATVSFGQSLDPDDLRRSEEAALAADVFLAIGTSLAVYPINETVAIAKHAGAKLIIVNAEPTAMDGFADVLLNEQIGDVLPAIVGMPTT